MKLENYLLKMCIYPRILIQEFLCLIRNILAGLWIYLKNVLHQVISLFHDCESATQRDYSLPTAPKVQINMNIGFSVLRNYKLIWILLSYCSESANQVEYCLFDPAKVGISRDYYFLIPKKPVIFSNQDFLSLRN